MVIVSVATVDLILQLFTEFRLLSFLLNSICSCSRYGILSCATIVGYSCSTCVVELTTVVLLFEVLYHIPKANLIVTEQ